jgi:hypothetical protein
MATDPLRHTENLLRDLVERLLRKRDGDEWIAKAQIPERALKTWRRRLAKEPTKRPGGQVEAQLLYYSDFSELRDIIDKNWEAGFDQVFSDKDRSLGDIDRLLAFRNPDAHARELLPFEADLVKGLTGQIRQEITLFYSQGEGSGEPQHFARIEELRDNFGNRVSGKYSGTPAPTPNSPPILRPGDSVTFTGRAWDPQGEELDWMLESGPRHIATGLEIEWTWQITAEDIGDPKQLVFVVKPTTREYVRSSRYDDKAMLVYRVLPSI